MDRKQTTLKAEELENRVAPGTLYVSDPTQDGGEATSTKKAPGKDQKL